LSQVLTKAQTLAFAFPGLTVAWLVPPMYAIMGDFYLRYTMATAAGIGTAMILSKLVDAVTDPPVGYLSDLTRSRWGARKPWIAAGTLLCLPMFWMFFNPPEDAGNLYFAVGIVFYYSCHTLIKIPLRAWLGEIAPDYADRSRVWSWFTMALLGGGLLIMALPLILSSPWLPLFDSAEFDRDMISLIGWVGLVGMPLTMLVALKFVPVGSRNIGAPTPLKKFFSILFVSPPYQLFLVGYGFSALGFGVFYSVIIVGITSYFGFADRLPLFMLCMIVTQVISIPFWERLARHFPKHRIWASAWLVHALITPVMLLFGANTPYFWLMVLCGCVMSVLQGPHMLFPVSIVSDIIDYDTLKNHTSRSGNFFAVFTFIDKGLHALGFGIGYYLLALFGYDAKLAHNSDLAVTGLMLAIVVVPSLSFLASALVLFKFPIDQRRHGIIRRRIEARRLRAAAKV
jgi:GPH family glycoside/pentoside/hexuronide:cation symporter